MNKTTKQNGFSLIELNVGMGIIAILIGLVVPAAPKPMSAAGKAQLTRTLTRTCQVAVEQKSRTGQYPLTLQESLLGADQLIPKDYVAAVYLEDNPQATPGKDWALLVEPSSSSAGEESGLIEAPSCIPAFTAAIGAERRRERLLEQISAIGIEALIELTRLRPFAEGLSANSPEPLAILRSTIIQRQAWLLLTAGTDEPTVDQILHYQHRGDPQIAAVIQPFLETVRKELTNVYDSDLKLRVAVGDVNGDNILSIHSLRSLTKRYAGHDAELLINLQSATSTEDFQRRVKSTNKLLPYIEQDNLVRFSRIVQGNYIGTN